MPKHIYVAPTKNTLDKHLRSKHLRSKKLTEAAQQKFQRILETMDRKHKKQS